MDDRVIPDVMDDVLLLQGRYPENFIMISKLEVCLEREGRGEVLDVLLLQGRYPEILMMISKLQVCQGGGGVTWKTLMVPELRPG